MVQHDAENWRAAVLAANSNNILAVVISVAIRNNMAGLQVTWINTGIRRREGFGGGHVASLAQLLKGGAPLSVVNYYMRSFCWAVRRC